ncbi:HAAS domain-containing protein [Paenibacillus flagellatus]|nr:DUF1700 domain-containing protein [Paenibacillus flagellatus]
MTKAEFFELLEQKLRGVPEPDRTHILQRYEDLFYRAMANGEPEEQIAYRILYQGGGGAPPNKGDSSIGKLIAGAALVLFNLIFILGPFIAVCAVLFALGVVGVVLLGAPFLYFVANGLPGGLTELLFVIFVCVGMFGLGLVLAVGMSYVGPRFLKLAGKYVRWNVNAVRGL